MGCTRGAGHFGATFKKGHVEDIVASGARMGLWLYQELVQGLAHPHDVAGEEVEVGDCIAGQALQYCQLLP